MNSTIAALEAAFPLEKVLYCRNCGFRLNDLGAATPPNNCPICGVLQGDNNDSGRSSETQP